MSFNYASLRRNPHIRLRCPHCKQVFPRQDKGRCPHCHQVILIPAAVRKNVDAMRDRCLRISRDRRERLAKLRVGGALLATRRMRRTVAIVSFVVLGILLPTDYMLHHRRPPEVAYTPVGRTQMTLATLRTKLECFRRDCGRYPTDVEGLWPLRFDFGHTNWHGPYVDVIPPDLWRHRYHYACTNDQVSLWSDGPDGIPHTADDLYAPPPDLDWVRASATNPPPDRSSADLPIQLVSPDRAAELLQPARTNGAAPAPEPDGR